MLFENQKSPARKSSRMSLKLAALLFSSLVFMPVAGHVLQTSALASDLEDIQSAPENDGHFVRIGLFKSIVIRLPANAHDVIVGNPEIVDAVVRSKNTAYLFARAVGQTNIFFFDEGGQQILNLDLEVADRKQGLKIYAKLLQNIALHFDNAHLQHDLVFTGNFDSVYHTRFFTVVIGKIVNFSGGEFPCNIFG